MSATPPVQLIAVVGGSGAGKSWFVERVSQLPGVEAANLQLDNFYRDRSHLTLAQREQINFDVPEAIDWEALERVLRVCQAGGTPDIPRYDFATYSRLGDGEAWTPKPIVFVDGLWLLHSAVLRGMFSLKIYLDTPEPLRQARRLQRDVAERGYAPEVVALRYRTAAAMHERHVGPQKKWADVVLAQPFQETQLAEVADRLWSLLNGANPGRTAEQETFRAEFIAQLTHHEYCT